MTPPLLLPEPFRARLSGDPLTEAFTARRLFPGFGGMPEPVPDPAATWNQLLARRRSGKTVAYINVPFCANHCLYCGFYSNKAQRGFSAPYIAALEAELALDSSRPAVRSGPIHAVYFGGGTPTSLEADDLYAAIRAVRSHLPLAADCEITIEGRVYDFDLEKALACVEAGANRFSIGIQSFDTDIRRRLGRKADRETAIAQLAALRDLDQATVICDLIYGLPQQTPEMWRRDVQTVIDLELDGVDLYALNLFPNSPLAQSVAKGALPPPLPLAEQARMYATGLEMLEDAGWRHLTQAHWVRTTRERNLYNQLTKELASCLAYGSGAGGLLAGHRYMLDDNEESYRQRLGAGEKPLGTIFAPAGDLAVRRAVNGALEAGRIPPARLEAVVGPGFADALAPALEHWTEAGLLRPGRAAHHLTTAGWFWQGTLIAGLNALTASHGRAAAA